MKSENKRNLFFIGVGPGDPELLTLKSIRLIRACDVLFVPGVSSINGAAASSGKPLVFSEEKLAILPTTYSIGQIESFINDFETVVLMKAHSCMDAIMQLIVQKGLLKTSFIVEKATMTEERIHCMADIPAGYRAHYMSTVFIKTSIK